MIDFVLISLSKPIFGSAISKIANSFYIFFACCLFEFYSILFSNRQLSIKKVLIKMHLKDASKCQDTVCWKFFSRYFWQNCVGFHLAPWWWFSRKKCSSSAHLSRMHPYIKSKFSSILDDKRGGKFKRAFKSDIERVKMKLYCYYVCSFEYFLRISVGMCCLISFTFL